MEEMTFIGWIKVWRKLASDSLWLEERFTKGQAWVDLLLLAQGLDRTEYYDGQYASFKAGTVYKPITWLATRWGWNRRTASHFLSQLEKANMIRVTSHPRIGSVIQIVNWKDYQSGQNSSHSGGTWKMAENPQNVHMGNGQKPEKCTQLEFGELEGFEGDFEGASAQMSAQITAQMTAQMSAHKKEDREDKEDKELCYVHSDSAAHAPSAPLEGGRGGGSGKEKIPAAFRDRFDSYEAYDRWRNQ